MNHPSSPAPNRSCQYLSVLALIFMILGISIHLVWFYSYANGGPTHATRVEMFNSFFPSLLHGNISETPMLPLISALQVAFLVLAIVLAVSTMWGVGRLFRIVNFIVMLLSVLALPLTGWMLM